MGEQANWGRCQKCDAMFYNGNPEKGVCPPVFSRPTPHSFVGSNFNLSFDVPDSGTAQSGWRGCRKCGVLFFDGEADKGHCATGGAHEADGNNFTLPHDILADTNTQPAWRFCQFCHALFFDGQADKGQCPARATLVSGERMGQPRTFHYDGHQAFGFDYVLPFLGPAPEPPPFQITQTGPIWTVSLTHLQAEAAEGLLSYGGPTGQAAGVIQFMDAVGGDHGVEVTGVIGVQGLIVTPQGSGMYQRLIAGAYAYGGIKTIADYLLKAGSAQPALASELGITTAAAEYSQVVASSIPLGWAIVSALGGLAKLLESPPDPNEHGGVHADRQEDPGKVPGDWEKFILSQVGPENRVALLSWLGLFSAQGGGGGDVYANRPVLDTWETWNFVDNHDGTASFRAFDGEHFLSASNGGGDGSFCVVNQASNTDSSARFVVKAQPDGRVAIQTAKGTFLSVQPGK